MRLWAIGFFRLCFNLVRVPPIHANMAELEKGVLDGVALETIRM